LSVPAAHVTARADPHERGALAPGSPARATVERVNELIARPHDKAAPAGVRARGKRATQSSQDAPAESVPQVSTAEPEIGAPAKGDA